MNLVTGKGHSLVKRKRLLDVLLRVDVSCSRCMKIKMYSVADFETLPQQAQRKFEERLNISKLPLVDKALDHTVFC